MQDTAIESLLVYLANTSLELKKPSFWCPFIRGYWELKCKYDLMRMYANVCDFMRSNGLINATLRDYVRLNAI